MSPQTTDRRMRRCSASRSSGSKPAASHPAGRLPRPPGESGGRARGRKQSSCSRRRPGRSSAGRLWNHPEAQQCHAWHTPKGHAHVSTGPYRDVDSSERRKRPLSPGRPIRTAGPGGELPDADCGAPPMRDSEQREGPGSASPSGQAGAERPGPELRTGTIAALLPGVCWRFGSNRRKNSPEEKPEQSTPGRARRGG